ncbi:hypothetical protein MBCUT_04600 [Methanobrevibacter cuticularis]|uniref:DUF362 domain-containing protein n=1 Tax=Methanobrevibacter cuticularis TaxID=47311 RepID=A0A166EQR9_9EURY|nr:DUF362 domain-containing protein [Methanobrevibacter cuticularis]KZX16909.1 hypothetical protein MBCUT_04600 [Methanobrevibacter cuticularis]
MTKKKSVKVFIIKTKDRKNGIDCLMDQVNMNKFSGNEIALKANFNSADPFPASSHLDTVERIIENLKKANIKNLTLLERSGMGRENFKKLAMFLGDTTQVLEKMGVLDLSKKLDFDVIDLDKETKDKWEKIEKNGTHWLRGFYLPKLLLEADNVVQTCCLKTHRVRGDFSMSLKNSVGLIAKKNSKNFI